MKTVHRRTSRSWSNVQSSRHPLTCFMRSSAHPCVLTLCSSAAHLRAAGVEQPVQGLAQKVKLKDKEDRDESWSVHLRRRGHQRTRGAPQGGLRRRSWTCDSTRQPAPPPEMAQEASTPHGLMQRQQQALCCACRWRWVGANLELSPGVELSQLLHGLRQVDFIGIPVPLLQNKRTKWD